MDLWAFRDLAPLAVAAAATCLALTLVVSRRHEIARRTGLVDDASKKPHAAHSGRVPLVGGLAWLTGAITFIITLAVLAAVTGTLDLSLHLEAFGGLLLIAAFFIMGFADDIWHLSPRRRLVLSILFVAGLLLLTGDRFLLAGVSDPFLGIGLGFGFLSGAATVLAMVALVNALNMSDGRNGIVAGMTVVWSLALASKASDMHTAGALLVLALNGLLLGWHNLRGRLFFGDSGTYAIAAFFGLAALSLHNGKGAEIALTSLQVFALFEVLVLDMLRLIFLRVRAGRSPMAADHNHLHHRLDDRFGWPAGLPIYLALVALPVAVAFQPFVAAGATGVVVGLVAYLSVILFTRSSTSDETNEPEPLIADPDPAE